MKYVFVLSLLISSFAFAGDLKPVLMVDDGNLKEADTFYLHTNQGTFANSDVALVHISCEDGGVVEPAIQIKLKIDEMAIVKSGKSLTVFRCLK